MYKCILFCLMLWLPVLVWGQRKLPRPLPGPPSRADNKCADKADQCLNSHKYNAKQRRAFYPFNVAKNIRLISYESMRPYAAIRIENMAVDEPGDIISGVKPGEFVVDYSQVKEFIDLSKTSIDALTDILYNVGFTPIKCNIYNANPGYSCYEPRNAILFTDKNGKVVQYMEFCFACQRYYLSSARIRNAIYCEQKFDMIRNFFASQAVKYGTNKER
ncbi:MAG: hypothetical protein V4592_25810 [Bacteroidota bacterium]